MRKKIGIIISVCVIVVITLNIMSCFLPVSNINKNKAIRECNELNIVFENEYVTREEFLESVLRIVGLNEYVFDRYYNTDFSTVPTDDFNSQERQYSIDDPFYTICFIAKDLDLIQTKGKTECYYGKDDIKLQEAISIIQACLSDVNTENGLFKKRSKEFISLFVKSHISGIVTPLDLSYLAITNPKLKRDDVYILLSRLIHQKRYKYLVDTVISESAVQIDTKRSITYKEYLQQLQ